MRLGIMQAYFFPYIGYFQLIASVDRFMLYENVSFRPGTWMTRNYILPRNGRPAPIFIPALHGSSNRAIREVGLAPLPDWKRRLLDQVRHAYARAAYFDETYGLIEGIFARDAVTVHEFNSEAVKAVCRHLGLGTVITSEQSSYLDLEEDLAAGGPGAEGTDRKTARITAICRREGADVYHNPIGGLTLYSREAFAREGIKLVFLRTKGVTYGQFGGHAAGFVPDLSIVDVLMHCGREGAAALLDRFETV